ncbi:MAG: arsenate reductase (glutaredoxin) [Bacteroidota bacterium]
MKIFHNPRCSKSRQGLAILEDSNLEFEIIQYLKNPPGKKELGEILQLLQMKPIDLVRKNEAIWKENFKGKDLSDDEVIDAMVNYPKLIERPIVINGDKAALGRPPENIKDIL